MIFMLKLIKFKDNNNNLYLPDSMYQKVIYINIIIIIGKSSKDKNGKYILCCRETFNHFTLKKEIRKSNNIPKNFTELVLSDIV